AFTLIEMILAIGVAAIVLVAINAVLFTALHLREVTSAAVDAATPLDQATTFLRRDLQCAVTPNGILSGDFKIGTVNSTGITEPVAAEMFTATGALSQSAPWADIQRVTYELKNSTAVSGRRDLYRSVTRNLLSVNTPDVTDQLLLNGVESVKFSGYDGAQWVEAWDTTDPTSAYTNLPLAVRVEIKLAGGDKNNEPIRLVVPIDSVARTNAVIATN
ncbi:MAG TPA: type II secretion system protein GspJ, partial [Verrucomicrobiae bacterium]